MPPHSQQLVYRNFQREGEIQEQQHEQILDRHREHFDMELQNRQRLSPKRHRSDAQNKLDTDGINNNNRSSNAGGTTAASGGVNTTTLDNINIDNFEDSLSTTNDLMDLGNGDSRRTNELETDDNNSDNVASARTRGHNNIGIRNVNISNPRSFGFTGNANANNNNSSSSFRSMYPLVRRSFITERLDGIYRPPGRSCSLNEARDIATAHNRWLLVNYIDNDDPRSHRLLTDLYSADLTKLTTSRFFYMHTVTYNCVFSFTLTFHRTISLNK